MAVIGRTTELKEMTAHRNLDNARRHHASLREVFARHTGETPDVRALRRAVALCEQASAAVSDSYCSHKLNVVEECAAELFSHGGVRKWDPNPASSAQYLRQRALDALELIESRLYSLGLGQRLSLLPGRLGLAV
jgi:hypothetical protein